jgi:hypothetical protein
MDGAVGREVVDKAERCLVAHGGRNVLLSRKAEIPPCCRHDFGKPVMRRWMVDLCCKAAATNVQAFTYHNRCLLTGFWGILPGVDRFVGAMIRLRCESIVNQTPCCSVCRALLKVSAVVYY